MRHWAIAAGAAIGVGFGVALGVIAWPVDPGRVQREFASAFGPLEAPHRVTLTLLPRPTLRIEGVKGAAGGALTASAGYAIASLRFDRLLVGDFAPVSLTLKDAEIRIDVEAAKTALKQLSAPALDRLSIERGAVEFVAADPAASAHLDIGSARLVWTSASGPLRAELRGRWRSQPVEATAELAAPLALARGEASPVRAAVDAPLAQLRFAGEFSPAGKLDGALYRGQASALAPSIPRFARWIGLQLPPGHAPPGLEVQAKLSAHLDQWKLADASLTLGGQAFEGAFDLLRTKAGVAISGTLAADSLDLEPLIGPPPVLFEDGEWSKAAALPAPSDQLDLDLRVSATRATWRGVSVDNPAAAVSQRNGRLVVKLLDAGFSRGSLSGEMSVEDVNGVCRSRMSVDLENADLGALLAGFGERHFSGQGGLKASVVARGRSPADIAATADGDGSLEISDGALRNLNFEEALRRGRRKLIDVARDMGAGATRFGAAHGRVEISNGQARFVDATTQAPGVSLALSGEIDLVNRSWRAKLAARQTSEDGQPTPDGAHIDFALYGPWGGAVLAPLIPPAD